MTNVILALTLDYLQSFLLQYSESSSKKEKLYASSKHFIGKHNLHGSDHFIKLLDKTDWKTWYHIQKSFSSWKKGNKSTFMCVFISKIPDGISSALLSGNYSSFEEEVPVVLGRSQGGIWGRSSVDQSHCRSLIKLALSSDAWSAICLWPGAFCFCNGALNFLEMFTL